MVTDGFPRLETAAAEDEAAVWPQLVLVHSNRLCLVCLSPEHPVVKGGNAVMKVDFQVKKLLHVMTFFTLDLRSTVQYTLRHKVVS